MGEVWKFRKVNIMSAEWFLLCYTIAVICADHGAKKIAALVLLLCAVTSYGCLVWGYRNVADLRALLCLSWEGGLSLAILRLSTLHDPWTLPTVLSFGAFPIVFLVASGWKTQPVAEKSMNWSDGVQQRLLWLVYGTCAVSAVFFLAEVVILGFVPAFSKDTHAYNTFHVTGLHYFTVSSMMVHALSMLYLIGWKKSQKPMKRSALVGLIMANGISLLQTLLCISKLQFLLIFGLPLLMLIASRKIHDFSAIPWKKIIPLTVTLLLLGVGVVVAFTQLRHYEPGYLADIFAFRNPKTSVAIQYPYMYVANNYANFNYMTMVLPSYTWGLKQLFPVFGLTGLKFLIPSAVLFPNFSVKPEINTLTVIYDAYYDFGLLGVILFALLLGMVVAWLGRKIQQQENPIWLLAYGQMAIYCALSFFSAWFSVTTTWFWFGLTILYYWIVRGGMRHE